MPASQYENLTDSVLHWKKTNQLGRFDPSAKTAAQLASERCSRDEAEIESKQIEVGRRCRVGDDDVRRGVVAFAGKVDGLGGEKEVGARWVGVMLDEPVGKNDGSVVVEGGEKKRLFDCAPGFGLLVRPEKVEVGEQWVPLDDLGVDEDMEEL